MSIFSELEDIEPIKFLLYLSLGACSVCPGFLVLVLFGPELLTSLTVAKIILFAASVSLPALLFEMMVIVSMSGADEQMDPLLALMVASFFTMAVFYPSLLIAYLFKLSFRWFLLVFAFVQVLVMLLNANEAK